MKAQAVTYARFYSLLNSTLVIAVITICLLNNDNLCLEDSEIVNFFLINKQTKTTEELRIIYENMIAHLF